MRNKRRERLGKTWKTLLMCSERPLADGGICFSSAPPGEHIRRTRGEERRRSDLCGCPLFFGNPCRGLAYFSKSPLCSKKAQAGHEPSHDRGSPRGNRFG